MPDRTCCEPGRTRLLWRMAFRGIDAGREIRRYRNHLPHWRQAGVTCFVTFRLEDSIPQEKLARWEEERRHWLRGHGLGAEPASAIENLSDELRHEYHRRYTAEFHQWLD